jgi:hypothetical protein
MEKLDAWCLDSSIIVLITSTVATGTVKLSC